METRKKLHSFKFFRVLHCIQQEAYLCFYVYVNFLTVPIMFIIVGPVHESFCLKKIIKVCHSVRELLTSCPPPSPSRPKVNTEIPESQLIHLGLGGSLKNIEIK